MAFLEKATIEKGDLPWIGALSRKVLYSEAVSPCVLSIRFGCELSRWSLDWNQIFKCLPFSGTTACIFISFFPYFFFKERDFSREFQGCMAIICCFWNLMKAMVSSYLCSQFLFFPYSHTVLFGFLFFLFARIFRLPSRRRFDAINLDGVVNGKRAEFAVVSNASFLLWKQG